MFLLDVEFCINSFIYFSDFLRIAFYCFLDFVFLVNFILDFSPLKIPCLLSLAAFKILVHFEIIFVKGISSVLIHFYFYFLASGCSVI